MNIWQKAHPLKDISILSSVSPAPAAYFCSNTCNEPSLIRQRDNSRKQNSCSYIAHTFIPGSFTSHIAHTFILGSFTSPKAQPTIPFFIRRLQFHTQPSGSPPHYRSSGHARHPESAKASSGVPPVLQNTAY